MTSPRSPRRGRPPEAPEKVRSHRVVSYLTSSELRLLSEIAAREGDSISSVIHRILVAALENMDP